ncbi:hypothetical protein PR202_gb18942 [Eleusine coracana subsp. coracana]|uniref:Radical SAM core domain-containing protein n=1 Tax=Eleusine coracana subsp. coracana TaxID=191504 RepID=A0AAV5F6P2_ELECO|nr:hypothetical protein PR202_gb18942 [Eleusine coracana subsp. coracana]
MASAAVAVPSRRSVFDASYIRSEFAAVGISAHFIPLIWKYVLQNPRCGDLDGVPSLSTAAYALLRQKFRPTTSTLTATADSKDRTTTKLLIRLQNGESVEAVIMRYDTRLGKYDGKPRSGGVRSTLCVSSQVGCKMGCRFCATGTMGFKSNLSSGEIVEQLVHASRYSQIRNIVFMGMGEPMNNYNALVEAIRVFTESPFQLSPKRITVSTVVNLIPFNPIGSSSNFKTSSDQNVKKFQKVLRGIYNIRTTIRQEMGQDIAGACGQLVVSLPDERSAGGATLLSDIEDLRI